MKRNKKLIESHAKEIRQLIEKGYAKRDIIEKLKITGGQLEYSINMTFHIKTSNQLRKRLLENENFRKQLRLMIENDTIEDYLINLGIENKTRLNKFKKYKPEAIMIDTSIVNVMGILKILNSHIAKGKILLIPTKVCEELEYISKGKPRNPVGLSTLVYPGDVVYRIFEGMIEKHLITSIENNEAMLVKKAVLFGVIPNKQKLVEEFERNAM